MSLQRLIACLRDQDQAQNFLNPLTEFYQIGLLFCLLHHQRPHHFLRPYFLPYQVLLERFMRSKHHFVTLQRFQQALQICLN